MPAEQFAVLRGAGELPLAIDSDCEQYLKARLDTLNTELHVVDQLAAANDLPDATCRSRGAMWSIFAPAITTLMANLI